MQHGKHAFTALALALFVSLLVIGAVVAAPREGVTASLSVAQGGLQSSQKILATVTLSNPTGNTVRILRWFTPAAGLEEPIFRVTLDGKPVPYVGARSKRPAATSSDYLSLGPGESVTWVVDLGDSYDLSGTGQYEIAYSVAAHGLFDRKGAAAPSRDVLASGTARVKAAGSVANLKVVTPPAPPPPGTNSYTACTTTQQAQLAAARSAASTYASGAASYLNAATQTARYTTWFGVYDATRYSTVRTHFGSISQAMATTSTGAGISFDCSSKQNVYAYVYSNKPYQIYLGKVYWTAPATGTDSRAGTLIHEISHFTVVAGTADVVYGQTGAKNLAVTDPASAVRNADSHEYFAENTPTLP
ncbi:MAG: peptidase M35 [Thermoleophilia bacterium]|nr:peptidase M35 [Thermoleophilia bacterium]